MGSALDSLAGFMIAPILVSESIRLELSEAKPLKLCSENILGTFGSKLGAVGFRVGAFAAKLNSALEKPVPPNPGLNAGAFTLKVLVVGYALGAAVDLGTKGLAFAGCRLKVEGSNMDGLKVTLELAIGLNSLASTLSLDPVN